MRNWLILKTPIEPLGSCATSIGQVYIAGQRTGNSGDSLPPEGRSIRPPATMKTKVFDR